MSNRLRGRFPNRSSNRVPSWVLTAGGVPFSIDIDFVNDLAYSSTSTTISTLLSCTRSATTTYYTNSSGSLTSFGSNTLRYGDLGLFIEDVRTNYFIQSGTFSGWTLQNASLPGTTTTAPDGVSSAQKLLENSSAGVTHRMQKIASSGGSGTTSIMSVYVKPAERTQCALEVTDNTTGSMIGIFTLSGSGTVTSTSTGGSWTSVSGTIQALANGWYRVALKGTQGAGTLCYGSCGLASSNSDTYAGDGASGAYFWGAQMEAGSFGPTSYIPTLGVTVTRNADNISFRDASPFASSVGTIYAQAASATIDATYLGGFPRLVSGNSFKAYMAFTTTQRILSYDGTTALNHSLTSAATTTFKAGLAYSASARSLTSTSGTLVSDANGFSGVTSVYLGGDGGASAYMHGYIKRFAFMPTKASDAALQVVVT